MIRRLALLALAALAPCVAQPTLAADPAPARHCVVLATEYESRGLSNTNVTDALRANARLVQARLLQRMQADKLVANTVFIDIDSRVIAAERLGRIRETTGCDTVVEFRHVFWSASFGSAFGFDVAVRRDVGGVSTTLYSQQYRYGVDKATIEAFSYDAFADTAWASLRQSTVLDADREARALDPAALRAEYDHLAAMWPRNLPEYHLRHILHDTERDAAATIAQLNDQDPPSFATLAEQSSEDKNTASRGGDMGWYTVLAMPTDMSTAVRSRDGRPGLIDRPVHADDGWHVLEILESRPSHAPPFETVSERIAARLRWTTVVPQATWEAALRQQ